MMKPVAMAPLARGSELDTRPPPSLEVMYFGKTLECGRCSFKSYRKEGVPMCHCFLLIISRNIDQSMKPHRSYLPAYSNAVDKARTTFIPHISSLCSGNRAESSLQAYRKLLTCLEIKWVSYKRFLSTDYIQKMKRTSSSHTALTGDFLKDLRSNRPQRPMGTRPLPWLRAATSRSDLDLQKSSPPDEEPKLEVPHLPPRSASALSLRGDASDQLDQRRDSHVARPLVRQPSGRSTKRQISGESEEEDQSQVNIPYVENGMRWMERQESRSISMALRDMDLKDQQKLHAAAQDEASELVWTHRNPDAPYHNPDAAKYKTHLRKGSHARAHNVETPTAVELGGLQSEWPSASDSSGSTKSEQQSSKGSQVPSNSSSKMPLDHDKCLGSKHSNGLETPLVSSTLSKKPYSGLAESVARDITTHRRTSSGSKRKVSRGTSKTTFQNPSDQIYEESEEVQKAKIANPRPPPMPLLTRRNPFARVKFAQQEKHERSNSEPILETKKFNRYEIHKNVPSQSRNPGYTSNPPTPPRPTTPNDSGLAANEDSPRTKDGKEIRGDDIRAATSMKMKDRSSKLPTPSVVSDKLGRPIVSFDPNWKPKEVDLREETAESIPSSSKGSEIRKQPERPSPMPIKAATTTGVPTLDVFDIASRERAHSPPPAIHNDTMETSIVVPVINVDGPPQIPKINEPDPPANSGFSHPQAPLTRSHTTPVPTINIPDEPRPDLRHALPSISIEDESTPKSSRPSIPSINVEDQARSSGRQRPLPTINAPCNSGASCPPRPLPTINVPNASQSSTSSRPLPTINVSSSSETQPRPNARPLPQPVPSAPRPNPLRHAFTAPTVQTASSSGRHWTPSVRRTQAQCAQCALPIAGRIVSAANQRFHPECFSCHHCGEGLECVAFYPEPDTQRGARLDRIRRRQTGAPVPEGSPSDFDDGDERLRFYCHLDFHEFFSPRCKSCKTPIEGEVVVACGAEWHVGHFFCAQCGDPFDAQTPFVEKDGYAWCVGCHTNRYSAKCRKCRRPVTDVVVKALGAEWHHDCFVCMVSFLRRSPPVGWNCAVANST